MHKILYFKRTPTMFPRQGSFAGGNYVPRHAKHSRCQPESLLEHSCNIRLISTIRKASYQWH